MDWNMNNKTTTMKNILLILSAAITISLVGCSKEEAPITTTSTDGHDKNGIRTNIKDQEMTFDRYHTKVDTFPFKIRFHPFVDVLYDDGSEIKVAWEYNGIAVSNSESHVVWNSSNQKWQSQNIPALGDDKLYDFGDEIKVSVQFSDGKLIQIENSIKENKIIRDVLGVNFGMSKDEVLRNELERLRKASSEEYQPNMIILSQSTNFNKFNERYGGITVYRFKDDKLIEVGEYTGNWGRHDNDKAIFTLNEDVVQYCKILGLNEEVALDAAGDFIKDYTWSNDNIIFTLSLTGNVPAVDKSGFISSKALGVSYKLK